MKKRHNILERDVQRWISQGLGQGERTEYKPWFYVDDVPSQGRSTRPFCITTGREHHLLSDIETSVMLYADYDLRVSDIREQYALLSREETLAIARQLGVKHPMYRGTNVPVVMTTDMVLTCKDHGSTWMCARSVKSSSEIDGAHAKRLLEKAEIERQYWARRNVHWKFITELEISHTRLKNLEWLNVYGKLDQQQLQQKMRQFLICIKKYLKFQYGLRKLLERIVAEIGLSELAEAEALFRHAAWHQYIVLDLSVPHTLSRRPTVIDLRVPSETKY